MSTAPVYAKGGVAVDGAASVFVIISGASHLWSALDARQVGELLIAQADAADEMADRVAGKRGEAIEND